MALSDPPKDSASGTISNADKERAGGKLAKGTPAGLRVRNGAQVANKAAGNDTNRSKTFGKPKKK